MRRLTLLPFAFSFAVAGCGDNGAADPDAPKPPDAAPDAAPPPLGFNDLEGGEIRMEWIEQWTAAGVQQNTSRIGAYFYKSMDPGKFTPPAFPGCVDMRPRTSWPLAQGTIVSQDVGGVTIKSQTGTDAVLTKNMMDPPSKDAFGRPHDLWWTKAANLPGNDADTFLPPNQTYDLVLAGSADFQAQTIEDFAFMPERWAPISPPASGGVTPGAPVLLPAGQDFTMTYTPVTSSNLPPGTRVNTFVAFTGTGHAPGGPIIACQEEGTDGSITLPAAMVDILRTYTPGRFVRQQLTHTFVELTADGEPKPPGERKRIDVLTIYCYNTGWAAAP